MTSAGGDPGCVTGIIVGGIDAVLSSQLRHAAGSPAQGGIGGLVGGAVGWAGLIESSWGGGRKNIYTLGRIQPRIVVPIEYPNLGLKVAAAQGGCRNHRDLKLPRAILVAMPKRSCLRRERIYHTYPDCKKSRQCLGTLSGNGITIYSKKPGWLH